MTITINNNPIIEWQSIKQEILEGKKNKHIIIHDEKEYVYSLNDLFIAEKKCRNYTINDLLLIDKTIKDPIWLQFSENTKFDLLLFRFIMS